MSSGNVPTILHASGRRPRRSGRRCRAAPRRATTSTSAARTFSACATLPATRVPDAELLQRGLAVLAGRHRVDVRHRERPSPSELGEVEAGPIVDAAVLSFGATSTMRLPSRFVRVSGLIRFLLCEVVHPVEVGGDEDVGRRALLDLLGERRARRVGDGGLLAGLASRMRV